MYLWLVEGREERWRTDRSTGWPLGLPCGKTARDREPVRCAEGIGKDVLSEFIDPDPRWISADITEASVVAPDGT